MGRRSRDGAPSKAVALRLSERETTMVDALGARWHLGSRSDVVRAAISRCFDEEPLVMSVNRLQVLIARVEQGHRIPDDEVFLTKAEVGRAIALAGVGRAHDALVPPLIELVRSHIEQHGWFYPDATVTLAAALHALRKGVDRSPGMFLRQRFRSFWQADDGPAQWPCDDPRWARLVAQRAGFNRRGELFDVSWRRLRAGLQVERHVVSFFQPMWAYQVYRAALGGTAAPTVWDPSGGFGARMLGFHAAYPNGTYLANEPATATWSDLEALREALGTKGATARSGSEHATMDDESLDFVFTSPPYFDTEKYFDEPGQSHIEYPDMASWVTRFVCPTMDNVARGLRVGALAAFNVSLALEDVFVDAAVDAGLKFLRRERLELRSHPFRQGKEHYEPILYFQKMR